MYIVISNPNNSDCGITRFGNLEEALEWYEEIKGYGAEPILTKVVDVKLTVSEE